MSDHRAPRRRAPRRSVWSRLTSWRVRAVLSLGIVLGFGAVGTSAYWTDQVVISGPTFTAGTLDLVVNDRDPYATTSLSMGSMVPGSSVAEVLTFKNSGTAPLKYTMTGGLTGTHAADYSTAGANGLLLTISVGGTRTASGTSFICSGGTPIVTAVPLTSTTTTALIPKRPTAPLAKDALENLCFSVRLADNAPTTLQGKTATATFTATGTSDVP